MADEVVRDIPEEMVAAAVAGLRLGYPLSPEAARQMARTALSAALAGRQVVDLPKEMQGATRLEYCRACRDERDEIVTADFILWGKLLPAEQLGPRCYDHTAGYIGWSAMHQLDQWAVFDLRPFNRMLAAGSGSGED